jgi:hypothetical protein
VFFLGRWQQSPESGKATLAWRRGLLRQPESYRGGCSLGLGGASPVLGGGSCVLGASGGTALLGSCLAGDAASSPLAGVLGSTSPVSATTSSSEGALPLGGAPGAATGGSFGTSSTGTSSLRACALKTQRVPDSGCSRASKWPSTFTGSPSKPSLKAPTSEASSSMVTWLR